MRISDWSSDVCSSDLDYDNTYEGCPVHSGVVIVPALFAAGEVLKLPARVVAKGVVVGIEIACRLVLVARKPVHAAGFPPTAIPGCLGAAAGVTSEGRRGGKEGVSTGRSRGLPCDLKK